MEKLHLDHLSIEQLDTLAKDAKALIREKTATPNDVFLQRRDNLIYLLETKCISQKPLTQKRMGQLLGFATGYEINQIIELKEHPVNGVFYMSDTMARKIETILNLDQGYMDQPHDEQLDVISNFKKKLNKLLNKRKNKAAMRNTGNNAQSPVKSITKKYIFRKKNLNHLIVSRGISPEKFAVMIDRSGLTIRNLANCVAEPYMRDGLARHIENTLGLDCGYMDQDHPHLNQ